MRRWRPLWMPSSPVQSGDRADGLRRTSVANSKRTSCRRRGLLALAHAAVLAMTRAKVRESSACTPRFSPQPRSPSCLRLTLKCEPAPCTCIDVGEHSAVHRRLLTHRLAFCAQVESGGRRPFLRGDNDIGNRQRQGGAAKGSSRPAWPRDAVGGLLGWWSRAAAARPTGRDWFAGCALLVAAVSFCPH